MPCAGARSSGHWSLKAGRPSSNTSWGRSYVAYLLLNPPQEPLHARGAGAEGQGRAGQPAGPDEALEQRSMGLEDAAAVRALWRRQRELERVLDGPAGNRAGEGRGAARAGGDHGAPAPESVAEPARGGAVRPGGGGGDQAPPRPPGRSGGRRGQAGRGVAGVCPASGRACWFPRAGAADVPGRGWPRSPPGCFTYEPPRGVVWEVPKSAESQESKVLRSAEVRV